jgi:hypothetical protein
MYSTYIYLAAPGLGRRWRCHGFLKFGCACIIEYRPADAGRPVLVYASPCPAQNAYDVEEPPASFSRVRRWSEFFNVRCSITLCIPKRLFTSLGVFYPQATAQTCSSVLAAAATVSGMAEH